MSDYPSINTILAYWQPRLSELYSNTGYLLDSGEPTCWACKDTFNGRFDCTNTRPARWDKSPLQRCHIVPRSLGGSADPSNFVLMCPMCHDLAPNTNSPEILFTWMRAQSKIQRLLGMVQQAFTDFGVPLANLTDEQLANLSETIKSPEFRAWSKPRLGLHLKQTSNPGPGMTISSIVGTLLEFNKRND